MTGAGAGAALVVARDGEVEVVGVAGGGDAVSEQDATTRHTAAQTGASLRWGALRPVTEFIKQSPVKFA